MPQWALALTTAVQNLTSHIGQQTATAPAEEVLDEEEDLDDDLEELTDDYIDVDNELLPSSRYNTVFQFLLSARFFSAKKLNFLSYSTAMPCRKQC